VRLGEISIAVTIRGAGPIYGIAITAKAAVVSRRPRCAIRKAGEHFDTGEAESEMRIRRKQGIQAAPGDFFKTNLWPVLLESTMETGSRAAQGHPR